MVQKIILIGALIGIAEMSGAQSQVQKLRITTDCKELKDGFEWAQSKALSYVMTGKKGVLNKSEQSAGNGNASYMSCYWAGYPHRTAFYSRDYCHQMSGAHLLGLRNENLEMLRAFAKSATLERKWYPLWAINFDGSIYTLDYRNDTNFVREIPASFELVEKAYKQLLWTGDKTLVNDPTLWSYYTKTVTEYISLHDKRFPNGVAEGNGTGRIFRGIATYNESGEFPYIEAGDGIASQYQALLAYSKMLEVRGETSLSKKFAERAEALKSYFNKTWSVTNDSTCFTMGYSIGTKQLKGFGRETSIFMPMKFITEPNKRNAQFLEYISSNIDNYAGYPENIESATYLPDLFFSYNRVEEGWRWTKTIIKRLDDKHIVPQAGLNSDYPEVSYTFISNVIENMLGVEPNALTNSVSTISRLPKEVDTLGVSGISVGAHTLEVTHIGTKQTMVKNDVGSGSVSCTLRFYGVHKSINVNEKQYKAKQSYLNGEVYSYVTVTIKAGKLITAKIS